jgi:peptide/nickel transport system substrate-binding protein/oligopeptide transport system substrate-binding protein
MSRPPLPKAVNALLCLLLSVFVLSCNEGNQAEQTRTSAVSTEKYGGTYRKPLWSEPTNLDPALVTSTYAASVVHQLFDGLVQFDADLNVVPSIARAWKASRDGLTWTFHLRQGVLFHHGRKVTAEDVVYSFTRILDPATNSPRSWLFERVQGATAFRQGQAERVSGFEVLDTDTVQITLEEPYAPFISMLGMTPAKIVPRDEIERLADQFGRQPIGTGPFRFIKWEPGRHITLQANQQYMEGRPFLDQLHYTIFARNDLSAALARFERQQLEDTKIFAVERDRLLDDPRYRYFRKPLLATLFLWLDTRHAPLNNIKVRQAINSAIDRTTMNRTIRKDRFVKARGILPPGMPGYNPDVPAYAFDLQRARQLLTEAGFPDGNGLPALELWSSVISSEPRAEHEAVRQSLAQIGITVELHTADNWKQYKSEILGKRPKAAMYRYAWYADFPDPDNFIFSLFHSQSSANRTHYHNPQVDQLISRAQREIDDLQRVELYRQAETLICADAPTVNLLHYTFEHLFQPYVRGIEVNALGERLIPIKKIWLDKTHHAFPKTAKVE